MSTITRAIMTFAAALLLFQGAAQAQLPPCADLGFVACGGDLNGTWQYVSINCFDPPPLDGVFPGCVGVTMAVDGTVAGTMEFNDGAYTEVATTNMTMGLSVPVSCLPGGVTCDMMSQDGATAAVVGDACVVTFVEAKTETEIGTYAMTGPATAVLLSSEGESNTGNFCVSGDTATVEIVDAASGVRLIVTQQRVQ